MQKTLLTHNKSEFYADTVSGNLNGHIIRQERFIYVLAAEQTASLKFSCDKCLFSRIAGRRTAAQNSISRIALRQWPARSVITVKRLSVSNNIYKKNIKVNSKEPQCKQNIQLYSINCEHANLTPNIHSRMHDEVTQRESGNVIDVSASPRFHALCGVGFKGVHTRGNLSLGEQATDCTYMCKWLHRQRSG
ncbi:jg26345 [Pararge aegeria aegeria]|uniref:Jg26345 protein n=1 Tax=Pararge aegeria aegeria TaxID=348720 RepID=A0A8S4QW13_9NEOP|nr:jg26345 [Pararge aegeria aegeria]